MSLVNEEKVYSIFNPQNQNQIKLNRILVVSDAAHSLGAIYKGHTAGTQTDISIFSLHSVKNITTGEGGAICINFTPIFDNLKIL